jgi:membrane protease YdiL (CAAX protease family)
VAAHSSTGTIELSSVNAPLHKPGPAKPAETLESRPDTRLGVILRVAFFVGTVVTGVWVFTFLFSFFGMVVAGTFGMFMTGLSANLLTMRIFDRRPLVDIGLGGGPGTRRNFLIGMLAGGGAAAAMLVAPLLAGTGHLVPRENAAFAWSSLLFYLAVLLFGAAGEEMIFRGYAFQLLIEKIGPFATILPVGVIFGFGHSFNPHATKLAVLNTMLWGILLGYSFLRSRDLWLPIGLHYGWNAVLPLFGVNLSGLTIEVTRYFYRWDLTPLWSGGAYGPEGGLLTTIFVIALFFLLARAPIVPQPAAIARTLNEPA